MTFKLTIGRLFHILVFTCISLVALPLTAEQKSTCPGGIPTTANDAEFELKENGEVLHLPSNLIFMRCSIGQTWDGNTCLGEADSLTWKQALEVSLSTQFNQLKSWRLPNLKELSVILERACVRPSINQTIFPNTPSSSYWTNTPSTMQQGSAWSVAFSNASNTVTMFDRSMHVRLVRPNIVTN